MKKITRTFEEHVFHPAIVRVSNGQVMTEELEPLVIEDEAYTEEKAIKIAKKNYGKDNQYVIMSKQTYLSRYEMDVDMFKAQAIEIDRTIAGIE